MFDLILATSVLSTTAALLMCRLRFALFDESKWRRDARLRKTFPEAVILNRFEAAFRVLLREMGFGIRRER